MDFCDLDCRYATFPKSESVDGSRSCRTFIALYCRRRETLVHKNLPCGEKASRTKNTLGARRKIGKRSPGSRRPSRSHD